MKRSGFTMIELVFVIVILGILASVAIPKLAATRDDANIAKATTEISSMVQDLGSYYTAHGKMDTNVSGVMTNVPLYTDNTGASKADGVTYASGIAQAYYIDKKRQKSCLKITINDTNGTVTLAKDTSANGADGSIFCKGLVNALTENGMIKTYSFGGSSIY